MKGIALRRTALDASFGIILSFLLAFNFSVLAEEATSESKIKIEAAKEADEQKPAKSNAATGEADELITNKRIRAESGSTSKYSIAVEFDYNGGSVRKPLHTDRPNISEGAELTSYSGVEGNVSGKININKVDSLFLGMGLRAVTPFSKQVPEGAGQRLNAADPYIIYQRISRFGDIQSMFNIGPTLDTAQDIRATGTLGNVQMIETLAYDFGGSRITVGGEVIVTYRFFNRGINDVCTVEEGLEDTPCGDYQSDYSAGINPFFEYEIDDNISFRTVLGLLMYDHARPEERALTMDRNLVYQSVGFGISMLRDFYLFPYIQFLPADIRADRTNVAVNTVFNLF